MQSFAKLPIVGSKALLEQANQLEQVQKKMVHIQDVLGHFINNEYIYQQVGDAEIYNALSFHSRRNFPFDIRNVDWVSCIQSFTFGIRRYFMKEDCSPPSSEYKQVFDKF